MRASHFAYSSTVSFMTLVMVAACSSSSSSPGPTVTDTGSSGNDTTTADDTATINDTAGGDTILPDGTTADTWVSFAHDFFVKYCTECHDASDTTTGDFSVEANVMKEAPTIRCGVAATKQSGCGATPTPKQFPICDASCTNPKPTDAERTRIVAWIDAGMP
jgi:hypothetical protein